MAKYDDYDVKLIQLITDGTDTFGPLTIALADDNKRLDSDIDPFRVTDRRLQALRRKGVISYDKGRWHVN